MTVEIYGEKWTTNGSAVEAGGSVKGTGDFSCVGSPTTNSAADAGTDVSLETCTKDYAENTPVDLYASPARVCPAAGCGFKKWDGDCSGANCSFTMNAKKSVSAYFKVTTGRNDGCPSGNCSSTPTSSTPTSSAPFVEPGTVNLTVEQKGRGSGSVSLMHMGSLDGNDNGFDTNISGSSPWGLGKNYIYKITATPGFQLVSWQCFRRRLQRQPLYYYDG